MAELIKIEHLAKLITMLMNGDLDGLIIAKMASGKDIFGQAREEFINDARDKIGHAYA